MTVEVFQIPIASEFVNVINFVVIDLFIVTFVSSVTGVIAGYSNNQALSSESNLDLAPFDLPIIGGGLITSRGWYRRLLILLRISVIVAVSASTFGLEGQTQTPNISQFATVRKPGFQSPMDKEAMNLTQLGFSCGTWEGDIFVFGSMADNKCYQDVERYATIQNTSLVRVAEAEAFNCKASFSCDSDKPTSTYRCDKADLVCQGVPRDSGCANAESLETNVEGEVKCKSIIFPDDGKHVIGCADGEIKPESRATLRNCWKYAMNPEDARWWNETYPRFTIFSARAVFASANGIETREMVELPGEARPVTVINLWWAISVAWLALMFAVLVCAWVAFVSKGSNAKSRLHNEKSLVQMLHEQDDRGYVREVDL